MKYCPKCDSVIHEDAIFCQYCGHNTNEPVPDSDQDTAEVDQPVKPKRKPPSNTITPGKTIFGMIFIALALWGVSLITALGLLLIRPELPRPFLLTALIPQLVLRIFIGVWAFEDREYSRTHSSFSKIAAFMLVFLPLLSLVSYYYASRQSIRKGRFDILTVGAVVSITITALMTIPTYNMVTSLVQDITSQPSVLVAPGAEEASIPAEAAPEEENSGITALKTPVQNEAEDPEGDEQNPVTYENCTDPASITMEDEGEMLEVCGRVTNYGVIDCDSCPKGMYSFIKLDGTFQIVTYDMRFTFAWLDNCVRVADMVEILGDKPVFVYQRYDGYNGTSCTSTEAGEIVCEGGEYFQEHNDCR